MIVELRDRLKETQSQMKKVFDLHHKDRKFGVGDWVYLHPQPYRQTSLSLQKNLKLSPKFYEPFKVIQRIGTVAYRLDLPAESHIQPIFHISALERQLGTNITSTQSSLPDVNEDDATLIPTPQAILDRRMKRRRQEVLVH